MLILTPTMLGSLLAGVAMWLMFWYGVNHVDSIPQLRRRPTAMVLGLRCFKDGTRSCDTCLQAAPIRHCGRCSFSVASPDHGERFVHSFACPNHSAIRVGHNCGQVREELMTESIKAPQGKLFYIVTDPPTASKRCYLYHVNYDEKGRIARGSTFAPFKRGCRAFDDQQLADVYCHFLCELEEKQFHVVLEAGARNNS